MKITSAQLWRFSLPLEPTRVHGHLLQRRDGVLLELRDQRQNRYFGEIAPLPGVHRESLDEAVEQLKKLVPQLEMLSFQASAAQWHEPGFGLVRAARDLFPSVLFGVEQALWHMILASTRLSDGLDGISWQDASASLAQAIPTHVSAPVIKIKIGRDTMANEVQQLKDLARQMPKSTRLRLDANRHYSMEAFQELWAQIKTLPIEFVEEPLADGIAALDLLKDGVPLALDESLWDLPEHKWPDVPFYVCKPTRMGGISGLSRLKGRGGRVVISSTYESGVSLKTFLALNIVFSLHRPMGLGTYAALKEDLLVKRLDRDGYFSLTDLLQTKVDEQWLQRL